MLSDVIIALLVNSSANIMYALIKSISKSKCSECSFGCCTIKRDVALEENEMNLKYYIRDNLHLVEIIYSFLYMDIDKEDIDELKKILKNSNE